MSKNGPYTYGAPVLTETIHNTEIMYKANVNDGIKYRMLIIYELFILLTL